MLVGGLITENAKCGEPGSDGEWVVQLEGNTGRHRPEGGQSVGQLQLLLKSFLIGDIAKDDCHHALATDIELRNGGVGREFLAGFASSHN